MNIEKLIKVVKLTKHMRDEYKPIKNNLEYKRDFDAHLKRLKTKINNQVKNIVREIKANYPQVKIREENLDRNDDLYIPGVGHTIEYIVGTKLLFSNYPTDSAWLDFLKKIGVKYIAKPAYLLDVYPDRWEIFEDPRFLLRIWWGDEEYSSSIKNELRKDSLSVGDSDKLKQMAYKFAQMGNYFDRANSANSRNILAKEDTQKYTEFYNYGLQVLAQLKQEVESMKRNDISSKPYTRSFDNDTLNLLRDAASRLYWIANDMRDRKGDALSKKIQDLIKEYKNTAYDSVKDASKQEVERAINNLGYKVKRWNEYQGDISALVDPRDVDADGYEYFNKQVKKLKQYAKDVYADGYEIVFFQAKFSIKDSVKDENSFKYRGILVIKSSYGWKFIVKGQQYECATDKEAIEKIDELLG